MKILNIAGNIVRNAETRHTQADSVTSFTVAVNTGSGERKTTDYVECALWGKRGETLCQYLTKGTVVSVSGVPRIRQFEHKGEHRAEMQIRVNEIGMHGGRSTDGEYVKPQSHQADYNAPGAAVGLDEDIPFALEWR